MRDEIKYYLKLFDTTGRADERNSAEYVCQLAAIMACDQSDGYTKKWARSWLDEIKRQHEMADRLNRAPAAVA